jgi:NTP pyrophosphatase (non-canonical NTP hydrolase)
MSDLEEITLELLKFRDERDWDQFHTPKDLALAVSVEAAELLELYLWKENADPEKVKEEIADVIVFSLLLAEKYGFDVKEIVMEKMEKNRKKYPVEKAKGSAKKYTEYE